MGKHDAAPTHGWVIMSAFHRRMSQVFIILLIVLAVAGFTIMKKVDAECGKPTEYTLHVMKYDLKIQAVKSMDECPVKD